MALSKALNEIAHDIERGATQETPSIEARHVIARRLRHLSSIYQDVLKAEIGECGVDWDHIQLLIRSERNF